MNVANNDQRVQMRAMRPQIARARADPPRLLSLERAKSASSS
jgi:hypothetical protein